MQNVLKGLVLAGILSVGAAQGLAKGIVGQRPTDINFTQKGLESQISDAMLRFYDGSVAQYFRDRNYVYTAGDGRTSYHGRWEVYDGGQICVRFDNGFARCDTFVRSARRMVLILANGDRYPVRSKLSMR